MKLWRKIYPLVLFTLIQFSGCGDLPPIAGNVTTVPASTDISVNSTSTTTKTILINVTNSTGVPTQGATVIIAVPLNGRLPFNGAGDEVQILDGDGDPVDVAAPDGSNDPGTVVTETTDESGNASVTVQFPLGGDYVLRLFIFAARAAITHEITISTGS